MLCTWITYNDMCDKVSIRYNEFQPLNERN